MNILDIQRARILGLLKERTDLKKENKMLREELEFKTNQIKTLYNLLSDDDKIKLVLDDLFNVTKLLGDINDRICYNWTPRQNSRFTCC